MKCETIGTMVDRRLDFTFGDGLPKIAFDASRVHSGLHIRAEMHGWEQRLRDAAATKKTEVERHAAVAALVEHYQSGSAEWSIRGTKAPNPFIAALATKRNTTYAEAEAWYNDKLMTELTGDAGPEPEFTAE